MGINYLPSCELSFNFELKVICHLAKALICALDLLQREPQIEPGTPVNILDVVTLNC